MTTQMHVTQNDSEFSIEISCWRICPGSSVDCDGHICSCFPPMEMNGVKRCYCYNAVTVPDSKTRPVNLIRMITGCIGSG